ncbi:ubiquitin carboxyl-terminal hydrolase 38-like [Branchiostoma floridae]|uniref:Ubiquitin carboxyl-terminal hydrolase 38-like n=1 Tax=Branchiostoma floridae TaxID=7739 RepID=A0A9J7MXJ8_BRAFL|nr:ubiquitin carboxyl-terminal hydrolase 38-like [Branchiostoma floridae]XP_035682521.1 ubiquitin carboxyl-terminal hydrolase 38-like [Branchiostoma floridae]
MDKILEGVISSDHPDKVKKALIGKLLLTASKPISPEDGKAIFSLATHWNLQGETPFIRSVGMQVFLAWGHHHKDILEEFFDIKLVLGVLRGSFTANFPNEKLVLLYLLEGLKMLRGNPCLLQIYKIVQSDALRLVQDSGSLEVCVALSSLLLEFNQCIPRDTVVKFCEELVKRMALWKSPENETNLKDYIQNVTQVSTLLGVVWKKDQSALLPSLRTVFGMISAVEVSSEPSVALASIVPQVPIDMLAVITRSVVTDPKVRDANVEVSLMRMIGWLSWPVAKNIDQWLVAFLKNLAAVQKYTLLINITKENVKKVFSRLCYPVVRNSALTVLSHMLLSFQHSPEAFHQIIGLVPEMIVFLKKEDTTSSLECMGRLAELVHCLIYHHSGFPDLYEPVLDALKGLNKPTEAMVKLRLSQSAWTSQSNGLLSYHSKFMPRSETGKTGLMNLGNTCYMNSILQALYMADEFRMKVLSYVPNGAKGVLAQLQDVFAFLSHTQRTAYSPSTFLHTARPPWFTPGSQQDCSEFLKYLLDRIDEEEKARKKAQALLSPQDQAHLPSKMAKTEENCRDDAGTPPRKMKSVPGASSLSKCQEVPNCNRVAVSGNPTVETTSLTAVKPKHLLSPRPNAPTIIEECFGGKMMSSFRCLNCGIVSIKEELFTDLSLAFPDKDFKSQEGTPVEVTNENSSCELTPNQDSSVVGVASNQVQSTPQNSTNDKLPVMRSAGTQTEDCAELEDSPLTLENLLSYFLAPETLHGDNKYQCDRCDSLQDAERQIRISHAPSYLILTLMRFSFDIKTMRRKKIVRNVQVPSTVTLPVCSIDSGDSAQSAIQETSANYSLCAVVVHSGTSSESGHYYCYASHLPSNQHQVAMETDAQEDDGKVLPGQWFLFNDSRVSYTSLDSVRNITEKFPKDTAYVLLYKRLGDMEGNLAEGNGVAEPILRKDLLDTITKDNALYLQEQELEARSLALRQSQKACTSSLPFRNQDDDKNNPPGSCGGGGGGFNMPSNRFVF